MGRSTRQLSNQASEILERVLAVSHGELQGHPTVLSCGGIFLPRPRPINPTCPLYHILNTSTDYRSAKVVSAILTTNLLDEYANKEHLN